MRKPRDYDSELKALSIKARTLKERKVAQLGELVIACGADALAAELLAGALLAATGADTATAEGWRTRGTAFFQRTARDAAKRIDRGAGGTAPSESGAASA